MMFVTVYKEILGIEFLAFPAQCTAVLSKQPVYSYVGCTVHVVSHNWSSVVALTSPSESIATLPPFGPIEGQKWFEQISSL